VTIYDTPTKGSKPRRGRIDEQNRLWFAEYGANAIGLFDPKTAEIKEYKLPTKWGMPYDVVPNKDASEVWTGSMLNDLLPGSTSSPARSPSICCAHHQCPARLRRGDRATSGALGRQQPRRLDREGRAARLSRRLSSQSLSDKR